MYADGFKQALRGGDVRGWGRVW